MQFWPIRVDTYQSIYWLISDIGSNWYGHIFHQTVSVWVQNRYIGRHIIHIGRYLEPYSPYLFFYPESGILLVTWYVGTLSV